MTTLREAFRNSANALKNLVNYCIIDSSQLFGQCRLLADVRWFTGSSPRVLEVEEKVSLKGYVVTAAMKCYKTLWHARIQEMLKGREYYHL